MKNEILLLPEVAECARDNAVRMAVKLFNHSTGAYWAASMPYPIKQRLHIAVLEQENADRIQRVIHANNLDGHVIVVAHKTNKTTEAFNRAAMAIDDMTKTINDLARRQETFVAIKKENNRFKRKQHYTVNKFF